ncbi:polysaccharide pyruvyl transferase family protein [uncultured Clostridium sp.]|uniref:polysaccharide pyruvyl transferase family protein n=1 Tax=uncultured Clostridium sp. TaxID=59620 RepID=UPI0025CF819D|nr:polysaccharide pyruvyl transferase family protein [uncultured Clostridium sp.]
MKIGIITYHSAYNFGSVLQAAATQYAVNKLGYETEILNYRMESQYDFYKLSRKKGIKSIIKKLLYGKKIKELEERELRFEKFITEKMNLTDEFSKPESVKLFYRDFDTIISGSDQIWNKHSNELCNVDWKYMNPYILKDFNGRRISYASSIVNMTTEELNKIKEQLKLFYAISCREVSASKRLEKILNKDVCTVCDPTLLLNKEEWSLYFEKEPIIREDYILFYSLSSFKRINSVIKKIENRINNMKIVVLSPLAPVILSQKSYIMYNAGPEEFLNLINNAKCVITDSYHGTIFSINFGVDFYYLEDIKKNEVRVRDILNTLKITGRKVTNINQINIEKHVDYKLVNEHIKEYRKASMEYLELNLSEDSGK